MKVLIIRFSSIGDIVLTTPVARCLKQQLGAEVHFLTKKSFAGIVESNPNVDKVWKIEQQVQEIAPALKKENFDVIIDLHKNLRSFQVRLLFAKARYFSFSKLNWQKWLFVNFKLNRMPKVHIVDRYLKTIAPLGVVNDGKGLDFFIPSKDKVSIENWSKNALQSKAYVAFVIGAAHATKRLPEAKIVAFCQQIKQPIVLLGGKDEAEIGARIASLAGAHVTNACGAFNLNQSASVVQQAQAVVTHDTGLMHIAAAFEQKIVSVWGNTVPDLGMYPYFSEKKVEDTGGGADFRLEVQGLRCRPCSKIGFENCPKKHFDCMNLQEWTAEAQNFIEK
jgi:ADP-heptose:LPS heptosyltransferase